jgi:mRNA interferase RelE/StbE
MIYEIEIKNRAMKDLELLSAEDRQRVSARIDELRNDLQGDVKRLRNFIPRFRMRSGDYRVLFEVEASRVVIYRVRHRRDVYR